MPDHRDVDQLLDDMDDVITDWHSSRDSARWRPGPTASEQLEQQVRQAREAFRPTVEAMNKIAAILCENLRAVTDLVASPTSQAEFVLTSEVEAEQGCHCLCAHNHPGQWPCQGSMPASEAVVVRFGDAMVPMCPPCAGQHA